MWKTLWIAVDKAADNPWRTWGQAVDNLWTPWGRKIRLFTGVGG
jgi:hypothetical protein